MADPEGRGTHHTTPTPPDPHRWILQGLGIMAVAVLAGYDLAVSGADVALEVYLIIGGIAIGTRPETLIAFWRRQ